MGGARGHLPGRGGGATGKAQRGSNQDGARSWMALSPTPGPRRGSGGNRYTNGHRGARQAGRGKKCGKENKRDYGHETSVADRRRALKIKPQSGGGGREIAAEL
ncbi:hypothetical protein ACFOHS_08165 [Jhaorihella thermophila]